MTCFADDAYLTDMYNDAYYPVFLMGKVKASLVEVVEFLETGVRNILAIQTKLDTAVIGINDLQDELTTTTAKFIGKTVVDILAHYGIDINEKPPFANAIGKGKPPAPGS